MLHYFCAVLTIGVSAIVHSNRQEDYDITGQAFSEYMVNPVEGVEMKWFLQWKIEECFNSYHCLSLAVSVEIMELLIERSCDILGFSATEF